MNIGILTVDAFNELDSFISAGILNRMRPKVGRRTPPVGEKSDYVQRALANVERYIAERDKKVLIPAVSAVQ